MALTKRYMVAQNNIGNILQQIVKGAPPDKFNIEHLKGLDFKSSNDRGIIPLLKDLDFLSSDGTPTKRYHEYRDESQSKKVLGTALLEAYSDLFQISEDLKASNRKAIEGKFKATHGSTDKTASLQAATFLKLLELADVAAARDSQIPEKEAPRKEKEAPADEKELGQEIDLKERRGKRRSTELFYNIQIHLPATKDIEIYNSIFKSLRENILDD